MADMDYLVAFGQKGLDDIATGKKMIEESIAKIKELNTELATIGLKRLNSDDLKGAIKSYEDLKKKQEDFNKTVVQSIDLSKKMAKAKSDELKQIDADYKTLNKSIQDNANEYKKLSQEHARLRGEAKTLGVIYGTTSKEFLNAAKAANDLDKKLKEIDAALGQHQRSVGNYKAAWNGLGMSVQQIAREVPNFALSFTTGISAISNNLPILADEIKRARDENKALIESGKQGVPVWKQLAASIFSWQTALTIGITLAVAYSKEIAQLFVGAEKASDIIKRNNLEVAKSIDNEAESLKILKSRFEDATTSMDVKKSIIVELNNKYGEQYGAITNINDAEKFFKDKTPEIIKAMELRAQAAVLFNKYIEAKGNLAAAFKDPESTLTGFQKVLAGTTNAIGNFLQFGSFSIIDNYNKGIKKKANDIFKSTIEEQTNVATNSLAQYIAKMNQADQLDPSNPNKSGSSKSAKQKKADEEKKINDELTQNILKGLNDIELAQKQSADKEIAILDDKLNRGLITIRTYEKEKALIIKNSEEQISKLQIEYLMSSLRKYGLTAENEAKLREKLTDLQIQYTEKSRKADEEATKQKAQNFEGFVARTKGWLDDLNKAFDKKREEDLRKDKDYQQRKLDLQKQFVQDSLNLIFTLLAAENQAKIDSLQKEGDLIETNGQKEIDRINRSLLTAEEKEKKIRAQEARTAMQRQEIDRQIREERRKMAIADRAAALAQIVFNTAVAVTDPKNAFLIPLILAIAAVQTATVLATPLPQYAKGRQGGKAEFAIVGEKGHELVQERDGSMWVTGNKAHLAYLNEGAKVVPNHEFVKQANYYAMKDASRYKPTQSDNIIKDFLKLNLQEQRKINKGLSNLKNKTYINIDGSSSNYIVRKLNRK